MQSPARSSSRVTRAVLDEAVGDGVADPVLGASAFDDDPPSPGDVTDPTGGTRWPVPLTVLVHPTSSATPMSAASDLCTAHPRTASQHLYTVDQAMTSMPSPASPVAALTQPPSVAATSVHACRAMVYALKCCACGEDRGGEKSPQTTAQSTVEATVVSTARLCKAGWLMKPFVITHGPAPQAAERTGSNPAGRRSFASFSPAPLGRRPAVPEGTDG
jgi:hypothetical protein